MSLRDKISDAYLCILHILAMNIPFGRIKRTLYRLRGTKVGRGVDISSGVFIEESFPHLVTIEENVDIGPNVIIVTHDSSYHCIQQDIPLICREVIIKRNAYIGAGAIILPGVTIPHTVVAGVPARVIKTVEESLEKLKRGIPNGSGAKDSKE